MMENSYNYKQRHKKIILTKCCVNLPYLRCPCGRIYLEVATNSLIISYICHMSLLLFTLTWRRNLMWCGDANSNTTYIVDSTNGNVMFSNSTVPYEVYSTVSRLLHSTRFFSSRTLTNVVFPAPLRPT